MLEQVFRAAAFEGWGTLLVFVVALLIGLIGLVILQARTEDPRDVVDGRSGGRTVSGRSEPGRRGASGRRDPRDPDTDEEWPVLLRETRGHRGDIVVGFLRQHGIEVQYDSSPGGGLGTGQVVRVDPRDESEARRLLDDRDLLENAPERG